MLDHALSLARQGFRVFPLPPNQKLPPIRDFHALATTDEVQIREWWRHTPDANVGIETTGLCVLDVDARDGKQGRESLEFLIDLHGQLPPTYVQQTPSGGLHYVYKAADIRNSAGKIAAGIDVRGWHGYIVGAGSTIDGVPYRGGGKPVAPAPDWLQRLARAASPPIADRDQAPAAELDTPSATRRAIDYLAAAEPAVQGAGGDDQTYRTAARVRDLGVSEQHALALMLEHWNERCAPPWPPDDLATKIRNAYRYGENAPGSASPEADFGGVPLPPPRPPASPPAERPRLYFTLLRDIRPRFDQRLLVQRLLGHSAMSVIYGASNSGKTFIAMAIAWACATAAPFFGRRTDRVGVVYVAAEAGRSAEIRLEALRRHHGVTDAPLALVPCPVDLLRPNGDTKAMVELVGQAAAAMGARVGLVVIDTLSRVLAGGNENGPDDMGALVKHLDAIRYASGAHVLVVHHSGKSQAAGARGHSLLRAATDTEIEIADRRVTVTKQRDMDYEAPFRFGLTVVEVGRGPDGEAVTSCVVDEAPAAEVELQPTDLERTFLLSAFDVISETKSRVVAWSAWLDKAALKLRKLRTGSNGAFEKEMRQLRDSLAEKGAVKNVNKNNWLVKVTDDPDDPDAVIRNEGE